jgi:hypothetical protein
VCNFGSKGEKLKYRSTGRIFEVKKRTDPFVIWQSLDGGTQVLTGEKNIFDFFEKTLRASSRISEMVKSL